VITQHISSHADPAQFPKRPRNKCCFVTATMRVNVHDSPWKKHSGQRRFIEHDGRRLIIVGLVQQNIGMYRIFKRTCFLLESDPRVIADSGFRSHTLL
jgi:hypothetical protein